MMKAKPEAAASDIASKRSVKNMTKKEEKSAENKKEEKKKEEEGTKQPKRVESDLLEKDQFITVSIKRS